MTLDNDMTKLADPEARTRTIRHPLADEEPRIEELAHAARTGHGRAAAAPTTQDTAGYDDDDEDDGGLLEVVYEYRYHIIGAILALVVAFVISTMLLGGSPTENTDPDAGKNKQTASNDPPALAPRDTNIAIEEPVERDGDYFLRIGEIAWKGDLKDTDTGQELTLTGPTSAQFKRAVTLPSGAITTGVFGRAETGQPIIHATFHRTEASGEEMTSGTYYALDDDTVLVQGSYEDTREGDTVTRVYSEKAPGETEFENYSVTFDSPLGAPIPALVGWEAPAPIEDAQAEDAG